MAGTALLACRLVWEMTWLTWKFGPQMVGFSLAHGPYALLAIVFPAGLFCWFCICLVVVLFWKILRKKVLRKTWKALAGAGLIFALLSVPQGFYNRVFVAKLAASSRASDFLTDAAATGAAGTLKALMRYGVPVNGLDREGMHALDDAARGGHADIVTYLIHAGADVNAVNLYGDSPLEEAVEMHQDEAARVLQEAGAKSIKGDDAQREAAAEQIVHRDIEEMDSNSH